MKSREILKTEIARGLNALRAAEERLDEQLDNGDESAQNRIVIATLTALLDRKISKL
jgi:hypothetical protein